jgi:hypothetical protein
MKKNKTKSVERQVRVLEARELMNTTGGYGASAIPPNFVVGSFLPPSLRTAIPPGFVAGVFLPPRSGCGQS